MKLNEYQQLAMRTCSDTYRDLTTAPTMGLMIEAAEVGDLIHKAVHHGKEFNLVELKKELGDVLWNLAAIASLFNTTLEEIAEVNIKKLRDRHGDKYNPNFYTDDTIPDGAPVEELK